MVVEFTFRKNIHRVRSKPKYFKYIKLLNKVLGTRKPKGLNMIAKIG